MNEQDYQKHPQKFNSHSSPTYIIGGVNALYSNNFVQISEDNLKSVADFIETLPPEKAKELAESLSKILISIGEVVSRANL